jgi:rhamnosyltransferase subunit B
MHFLLTPVGSSGDVHPYVGIGHGLRERGHDVTVLTAEPHRRGVEAAGLEFVSVYTTADYDAATHDPDLWHPVKSFKAVARLIVRALEPLWRELEARFEPGHTFLVGHPLSFATRSFEEHSGAPAATLQLAPSSLRSVYRSTVLPPARDISRWPRWSKRALWWLIDRTQVDPLIAPTLNRWRASHGLPPVTRIFQHWMNSPQRVLGLFPEWFGARQPDWPRTLELTSFPLWDDGHASARDARLEQFLATGAAPVVVTAGTANRQAAAFFAATAGALAKLELRGLFLTAHEANLPRDLPESIVVRAYAPLSRVLPRSAALVHHGGIGTMAQAFAAGVPQLVLPMAFDQPDNAMRAAELGAARFLTPANVAAESVAAALRSLLDDTTVAAATARWRDALEGVDGIARACDVLERDAARDRAR